MNLTPIARRTIPLLTLLFATTAAHAATYSFTDLYTYAPNITPINTMNTWLGEGRLAGQSGNDAALQTGPNTVIDLHPTQFSFSNSGLYSVHNGQQVGYARNDSETHAMVWNGTAASATDLTPAGFTYAIAFGTSGTQQVGGGYGTATSGFNDALLWNGTAGSLVNLNPSNLTTVVRNTQANATDGIHQVGAGQAANVQGVHTHALLWSGTGDSAVDLHPTNIANVTDSAAVDVAGNQQIGSMRINGGQRMATLWTGTADSAVNLNPAGFSLTWGMATNGSQQVGFGFNGATRALVWSGTASSAINLANFTPDSFTYTAALDIDAAGNVYGFAIDNTGANHIVMWSPDITPVPLPAALFPASALLLTFAAARHFKRTKHAGSELT